MTSKIVTGHAAWRLIIACAALCAGMAMSTPGHAQDSGAWQVPLNPSDAFEPLPIAVSPFIATDGSLGQVAQDIQQVVEADLESSGLFRIIPSAAYISKISDFNAIPNYADWRAINADALLTATISRVGDGRLMVQYRVFDTQGEEQIEGQQVLTDPGNWRRIGHKLADGAYSKLTGEGPYFDSRIVFVSESGPKGDRKKRLAIMDQDGANVRFLGGAEGLVLSPRFAPNDQSILYMAYDQGQPHVFLRNIDTNQRERLGNFPGMTFAPRFSPDGNRVVLSLSEAGNTDLYIINLGTNQKLRLTSSPAIETSPAFSPDGQQIVYESDRGGSPQLYVMPANGGEGRRISFGKGSYGTPVWSPRGDRIAFTKILGGRFYIGVMRDDGSDERLLTSSFLDEAPTFSPNGRVIMFFRESPGANGAPALMSVDITGRNLRRVPTPGPASDPAWSPLRK